MADYCVPENPGNPLLSNQSISPHFLPVQIKATTPSKKALFPELVCTVKKMKNMCKM
jgi:hypothetical protein